MSAIFNSKFRAFKPKNNQRKIFLVKLGLRKDESDSEDDDVNHQSKIIVLSLIEIDPSLTGEKYSKFLKKHVLGEADEENEGNRTVKNRPMPIMTKRFSERFNMRDGFENDLNKGGSSALVNEF